MRVDSIFRYSGKGDGMGELFLAPTSPLGIFVVSMHGEEYGVSTRLALGNISLGDLEVIEAGDIERLQQYATPVASEPGVFILQNCTPGAYDYTSPDFGVGTIDRQVREYEPRPHDT